MAQFRPPDKLNFSSPNWDAWRSSFQTFRVVTQLDNEKDDIQIATLKYSMGPESEEVIKTFGLGDLKGVTYDQVLSKFDGYFKPRKNVIRLRRLFMKRVQQQGEDVGTYLKCLMKSAEECEFLDKSERVRDQFLVGLLSDKLIENLEQLYLSNPLEFTLEKVVEQSKIYEETHKSTARKSTNGKVNGAPQLEKKKNPTPLVPPSKTKPVVPTGKKQPVNVFLKPSANIPPIKYDLVTKRSITNNSKQPTLDLSRYRIP